ncbi:TPA: hypothetical protein GX533_00455 [Candidatus Dojkabacteria bacterium]|uniref:Carbohydrate kinase PfkB domain-containing protein n=1 Tax=Candidatus Dojkabacteria bacterium TaxID=2099670 RepID=A0A832QGS8_9BACT|nr:hypothetical protein [Candidatus Dojkabacteria bacterium]
MKKVLDVKQIELFENVCDEITTFEIDEKLGTCSFLKRVGKKFEINQNINIDYLHISFRKGVDIYGILHNDKIRYRHLSIDVMIHSIESVVSVIKKYKDKIDIIFCNCDEYHILKDRITDLPVTIVTNQDKPVVVIQHRKNIYYTVPQNLHLISTTGAGDSFIGGFLAKYSEKKILDDAVIQGIKNASYSITRYGPIDEISEINYTPNTNELPKNIIVIGNSCAGKTTFVDFFKSHYNIYTDIDDLAPLLEMFMIDDISSKNSLEDLKQIKDNLIFMRDIYEQYLDDFPNINHYSRIAKNGCGYDIINPNLWDIILRKSVSILKRENNIIQFSRGRDVEYEKLYGHDVYNRSLNIVLEELENKENTIIVNLISNLKNRKERNKIRHDHGGHFVSDDTMDNVYKEDIFKYEEIGNGRGFINLNDKEYPVYTINNNKMLSKIKLKEFFTSKIAEIIDYYQRFKEEKYGEY